MMWLITHKDSIYIYIYICYKFKYLVWSNIFIMKMTDTALVLYSINPENLTFCL